MIRGCVFQGNITTLLHGGGIRNHNSDTVVEGCVFYQNVSAMDGGGLMVLDSHVTVRSCTFYANTAQRNGGGIGVFDGTVALSNTILANSGGGGGLSVDGWATVQCCDAWANTGGNYLFIPDPTGENGNISLDPLFCDAAAFDLTIRDDSPCSPFSAPNPACDLIGACASPTGRRKEGLPTRSSSDPRRGWA